jgi:hypothetical protein
MQCLHINELFGQPFRPWQIQSDHYALKQLTPFYQAMGHLHTPAAVGNAKSKVIEPYFNHINKIISNAFLTGAVTTLRRRKTTNQILKCSTR